MFNAPNKTAKDALASVVPAAQRPPRRPVAADGPADPARRRRPRTAARGRAPARAWWALLFLAPTLIGLALLSAGPILASFGISLTKWDLLTPPQFVGLDNFVNLVNDPRFLVSLRNTAFYTLLSVPIGHGAGARPRAGAQPAAARDRADPHGLLPAGRDLGDRRRARLGVDLQPRRAGCSTRPSGSSGCRPRSGSATRSGRCPSIIAMSVWQGLGINVIIFLAGLQAIPQEYYDAAAVDGAARWSRFRHVTLPLLTPSLFFTGILSLIGSFQVFDQVYILARPGQADRGDDHARLLHLRERLQVLPDGRGGGGLVDPVPDRRRADASSTSGRSGAGSTTSDDPGLPGRRRHPRPTPVGRRCPRGGRSCAGAAGRCCTRC